MSTSCLYPLQTTSISLQTISPCHHQQANLLWFFRTHFLLLVLNRRQKMVSGWSKLSLVSLFLIIERLTQFCVRLLSGVHCECLEEFRIGCQGWQVPFWVHNNPCSSPKYLSPYGAAFASFMHSRVVADSSGGSNPHPSTGMTDNLLTSMVHHLETWDIQGGHCVCIGLQWWHYGAPGACCPAEIEAKETPVKGRKPWTK